MSIAFETRKRTAALRAILIFALPRPLQLCTSVPGLEMLSDLRV